MHVLAAIGRKLLEHLDVVLLAHARMPEHDVDGGIVEVYPAIDALEIGHAQTVVMLGVVVRILKHGHLIAHEPLEHDLVDDVLAAHGLELPDAPKPCPLEDGSRDILKLAAHRVRIERVKAPRAPDYLTQVLPLNLQELLGYLERVHDHALGLGGILVDKLRKGPVRAKLSVEHDV